MKKIKKHIRSITAFFPCYNDGGTIASIILMAKKIISKFTDNYEIIVVDDASTDYSGEVILQLKSYIKSLKVIRHKKNKGYGGALCSGFNATTKEWIFYTDGDAQYDIRELEKFIMAIDENTEVVQGYKIKRNDPLYRIFLGKTYNLFVKILFNINIKDIDCDFRLMRNYVAKSLNLESNSGAACVEMVKKMEIQGYKIKEMPVHHNYRIYGISQFFRIKRVINLILDIIHLKFKFFRM